MSLLLFILLLLFIFYILLPLLRISFKVRRQFKEMKEQFGGYSQGGEYYGDTRQSRKEERFQSSGDQYVKYEEVDKDRESIPYDESLSRGESQISDAQFEELPDTK